MFWIFVAASLALSAYALVHRSWPWMLVSGLLYCPMAWYLNATPRFRGALLLPLLYLAAAYALRSRRRWVAGVLLTPFAALSAWVALLVIFQPLPSP